MTVSSTGKRVGRVGGRSDRQGRSGLRRGEDRTGDVDHVQGEPAGGARLPIVRDRVDHLLQADAGAPRARRGSDTGAPASRRGRRGAGSSRRTCSGPEAAAFPPSRARGTSRSSGSAPRRSRGASPSRRSRARAPPSCGSASRRRSARRDGGRSRSSARRRTSRKGPRHVRPGRAAPRSRSVVRAHVEQRAGAIPEEDVGIGMPGLLPSREHRRRDAEGAADRAAVDQRARLLEGAAEEDVGAQPTRRPARSASSRSSAAAGGDIASGFSE